MIKLQNLTRRFSSGKNNTTELIAVNKLNFSVEKGEVFGFLGPNGAGKTTTVRMLTTLIAPSSGEAWVNACKVGEENKQIRQNVGILTESPGLYEGLSAWRNLLFFANLYNVPNPKQQAEKYLTKLDLLNRANEPTGTFSKGMKQKLALARALLHEPPILFLDEPTSGLDPGAAKMVREAIDTLSGEGRTIFLCTHNLTEAEKLCDHIAVISQGKIVALGKPEILRQQLFGQVTLVQVENPSPTLLNQLEDLAFVKQAKLLENTFYITLHNQTDTPDLVAALVNFKARVHQVTEQKHSLEDVYLSLLEQDAG